jgi:hypothetical protein
MLFGYPEMLVLGTSLKATRGSISSLPDATGSRPSKQGTSSTVNSKYLYDAVSNSGNSGGPLCDAGANVVAVHSTGVNTASRYAGGVPSTQALQFVKKNLPEFRPSAPSAAKLEWPQVDERASKSTMLIWIRQKDAKPETASVGGDVIELSYCLFCGGRGSGCRVCKGAGIDVELASVQRALAAANAAKAAANSPASSTPMPGGTSPRPPNPPSTSTATPATQPTFSREPPPSAAGRPIDLMAGLNPNQPYSPGSWQRRGSSIFGGVVDHARFAVGQPPPAEYDIELELREVKRASEGSTQLWVGLISSTGRPFNLILGDTYIGKTVDIGAWSGSTVPSMGFQNKTTIRILLREREIAVLVNGRQMYGRRYDPDRAIARRSFQMSGDDVKRLSIGSSGNGAEWEISGMKLIPLH